jgi:ABC-type bacteriocin/lantibiotic exporter with double-glycine peptidase domain
MRSVEVRGTVTDSAVCLQTSGVSCGAAAAVSFLYYYGIRTTEQEMATLCLTRDGGRGLAGTSDAGLVRGLRKKLAGRLSVQIARQTYEELSTPALVPIEVYPGVGHCVLVWRADKDLVHLVDPRSGRTTMPRKDFQAMWTGSAIWAEQDR